MCHGIEAKQCIGPDGVDTFVLIRSIERREKEREMHEHFTHRLEDGLTRLSQADRARRPLDVHRMERQVGRLLERNQRAAGSLRDRLCGPRVNSPGPDCRGTATIGDPLRSSPLA